MESGDRINEDFTKAAYAEEGRPQVFDVKCKSKSDGQPACRILLANENGAITFIQQGKAILLNLIMFQFFVMHIL